MPRYAPHLQRPPRSCERCALRAGSFVGVLLRKQVGSVTQWVETLFSGRAPNLPDTTGKIFLGQVINRCSCLYVVSKLTDQVEESFTCQGFDDAASRQEEDWFGPLQPFAMHSWLMTVEQSKHIEQVTTEVLGSVTDWPLVQVENSCSRRSGRASDSSGSVGKLRKKKYRPRLRQEQRRCCLRLKCLSWCGGSLESKGMPLIRGESRWWQTLFCDIGLFRWAKSEKVWAFACGFHDSGSLLDCLLLAPLFYHKRLHRCLSTWLTDYSQQAYASVASCLFAPSALRLLTTQLLAYSTFSVLHYLTVRHFAT